MVPDPVLLWYSTHLLLCLFTSRLKSPSLPTCAHWQTLPSTCLMFWMKSTTSPTTTLFSESVGDSELIPVIDGSRASAGLWSHKRLCWLGAHGDRIVSEGGSWTCAASERDLGVRVTLGGFCLCVSEAMVWATPWVSYEAQEAQ